MVTKANFNPQTQDGIWSEIICQHPETASAVETFKRGECNGFNGRIFNLPQISLHIKIKIINKVIIKQIISVLQI